MKEFTDIHALDSLIRIGHTTFQKTSQENECLWAVAAQKENENEKKEENNVPSKCLEDEE